MGYYDLMGLDAVDELTRCNIELVWDKLKGELIATIIQGFWVSVRASEYTKTPT